MQCTQCERVAHAGGLCRRCWNLSRGHSTSATSYTPRAGRVRYHGLSLLPGTVAAIERAASTGRRTRAVIAAILDAWATGKVWRPPRAALGALAVVLVVASSWAGLDCAARPPPMRVEIEPPPVEAFVATSEDALPRRVIPQTPADRQCPPGTYWIKGGCWERVGEPGKAGEAPVCRYGSYPHPHPETGEPACWRALMDRRGGKADRLPVSSPPELRP